MRVLYEDEYLFAVDKPGGLLTVPGRAADKADSLLSRLQTERGAEQVLLVHRLDRDTSGVIVFAKHKEVQKRLGHLFEWREVEKEYRALVWGTVPGEEGVVDTLIAKEWGQSDPPRYAVVSREGKTAVTEWRVLARLAGATELALMPRTGRSHQLRVHCRHMGHPILGDPIYGSPQDGLELELGTARAVYERAGSCLCLRAWRIRFRHPGAQRMVEISAGWP